MVIGNMENRSGHGVLHVELTECIGVGAVQSPSVLAHVVFLDVASSTTWSSGVPVPQISTNRFTYTQ